MIQQYFNIAKALEQLFYPQLEVVLHDIKQKKVIYIGNNFSNRELGDDSVLDDISFEISKKIIGPYEKINFDGNILKSISIVLEEKNEKKYLMCLNFDISVLNQLSNFIEIFIGKSDYDRSASFMFKDDWREKINIYINNNLKEKGKVIDSINKEEKKELIIDLQNKGAFNGKNSKDYVAKILKISRATVYNYLNEKDE
jgi:predicted transcriptional regulator YheO